MFLGHMKFSTTYKYEINFGKNKINLIEGYFRANRFKSYRLNGNEKWYDKWYNNRISPK
jgi:hypothetical protein